MNMQRSVLVAFVLIVAGCVSTGELSKSTRIEGPLPPHIRSVVIVALPMRSGAITNVDGLTDAPQLFAEYVKSALAVKRSGWKIKVADGGGTLADRALTINTELLQIDGGSAALRFWIGLGTGAIESRVRVSMLDSTGRLLNTAVLSEATICPVGACVESNETMTRRNLKSLAGDVAEFIIDPAAYERKHGTGS